LIRRIRQQLATTPEERARVLLEVEGIFRLGEDVLIFGAADIDQIPVEAL